MKHRITPFIVLLFIALVSTSPIWAQAPTKKVYLPVIIAHVEATQFAMPTVKQISATNYEMKLTGDDGSAYTINIAKDSTEFYPQKVHYTPAPDDGLPAATATISPDGSRMEVQADGSSLLWIVQSNGQTVTLTLKDGTQETEVVAFPLEQSRQSVLFEQQTNSTCAYYRNFCKKFQELDIASILAKAAGVFTVSGAVFPPLEVPAGILGSMSLIAKAVDVTCVILFADDAEALKYVAGEVAGKFLGQAFRPLQATFIKLSRTLSKQILTLPLGAAMRNRLTKFASDELFGQTIDNLADKLIELPSPIKQQLTNVTNNQAMLNLRKALGIGWCDIDEVIITCNGSTQSCDIPYGSSVKIQVSYNFIYPRDKVEIRGFGFWGLGWEKTIPNNFKQEGVINFNVSNTYFRNCYDNLGVFAYVAFNGGAGGLYYSPPINLIGNGGSLPCYTTGVFEGWEGDSGNVTPSPTSALTVVSTATPIPSSTPSATATPISTHTPTVLPTATAIATSTPSPAVMPTPTATATSPNNSWGYIEDFSNPNNNPWPVESDQYGQYSYQNGEYEVRGLQPNTTFSSLAPIQFIASGYVIEVEAHVTENSPDYGLLFDWQDWNNYYLYEVAPTAGVYRVSLLFQNQWSTLIDWTTSTAIKPDSATNLLKLVRVGSSLTLYVNDQQVDSLNHAIFPQGLVGVKLGTYKVAPATARFDNFKLQILSGRAREISPRLSESGQSARLK